MVDINPLLKKHELSVNSVRRLRATYCHIEVKKPNGVACLITDWNVNITNIDSLTHFKDANFCTAFDISDAHSNSLQYNGKFIHLCHQPCRNNLVKFDNITA